MKYIIELPEEPLSILALSTIKGIPKATKIETFEPYIEPDREAIENEVWEFARKLTHPSNGGLYENEKKEIFDRRNSDSVLIGMSYQEAKAKYDAWKKQKAEIRVGDEVEYECCDELVTFVVTGTDGKRAYGFKIFCDYDDVGEYCDIEDLHKTGRSFPEIADVLKKMGDEK